MPNTYLLRWNVVSDLQAADRERWQYGRWWKYKPHRLYDFVSKQFLDTDLPDDELDQLLVTVVPRERDFGARVVIFAGRHGGGSSGVRLLFNPNALPTSGLELLWRQVGDATHYQARFDVQLKDQKPIAIKFVQAAILDEAAFESGSAGSTI